MSSSSGLPFHPLIRSLDVRLRLKRLFADLGWFVAALALALVIPRLVGESAPLLVGAVAALGSIGLAFRFVRGASLAGAAAAGDGSGGLADEFGSAQWFFSQPQQTAWEAHQIARARGIADRLTPSELVPIEAPRATLGAVFSFVLLAALLSFFEGPLIPETLRARLAESLAGGGGTMNAPVAGLAPEEEAEDARREARSPEEVLEALRAGELRAPEEIFEEEATLDAALARAMEEQAFGESSEEVSAALAGLAESLEDAEWMEGLAEAMQGAMQGAATSEELKALLEALEADGALAEAAAEMAEMLEAGMDPQAAFEQLAENMQAMEGDSMEAQAGGEGQQMPFPGDGEGGGQPQAGEGGGEPAGGMPQGASGLSGAVQMMAAEGQMGTPMPMDAGPAGNMTGPGGGGESDVFGNSTSLEVQLAMEAIPPSEDTELTPEQIIERQSRREDATVDFQSARSLDEYAEETVARTRPIPAGLRPLVRAYFLMIRETVTAEEPEGAEEP